MHRFENLNGFVVGTSGREKDNMKNIWLIRHCESESNSGEKTQYPGSSIITEKGQSQAKYISSYIQNKPDLIVHSPYIRTLQSAQSLINKYPETPVKEWPVQEFVYLADKSYLNTTQSERKLEVKQYWAKCNPAFKADDNAESFNEFINRMEAIVEKLIYRNDHMIIFTHGHVMRAIIWKIITGDLIMGSKGMEKYRSLRNAIRIPNAAILKIQLNAPELEMSQLITEHIPQKLQT